MRAYIIQTGIQCPIVRNVYASAELALRAAEAFLPEPGRSEGGLFVHSME
jgi:hypothetical protein